MTAYIIESILLDILTVKISISMSRILVDAVSKNLVRKINKSAKKPSSPIYLETNEGTTLTKYSCSFSGKNIGISNIKSNTPYIRFEYAAFASRSREISYNSIRSSLRVYIIKNAQL